ncbi:MAG: hypothetical protein PW734_01155 [Verrucomicrobium sp.]|nr:hypothetical protein [Verrucomicrobium sp.]
MKTILRVLFISAAALSLGSSLAWSDPTYQTAVVLSRSDGTNIGPFYSGANGNASGVGAFAQGSSANGSSYNQVNSANGAIGSWVAKLYWTDTSSTNAPDGLSPVYSGNSLSYYDKFNPNSNTTISTNWGVGTPIPYITPYTQDAQLGTPASPNSIIRSVVGIGLKQLVIEDTYKYTSGTYYTDADRYGEANQQVAIYRSDSGSPFATVVPTASSTYNSSGTAYSIPAGSGLALNSPGSLQFSVKPNSAMGSTTFTMANTDQQATVYFHPKASVSNVGWSPANPSPDTFTYFSWAPYTATINATQLYPANFTWLEIQFTHQDGSAGATYYLYDPNHNAVNSDTDTSGNHTSGTVDSQNISITADAPNIYANVVSSSSSHPQNITFIVRLNNLKTAMGNNPGAGTYTFKVHSYSPLPQVNQNPGNWGTDDYASLASASFLYNPVQKVNSGVVTSPQ